MRINFILPFFSELPGGGIKIMYEYADRLSLLGHTITIYHLLTTPYMNYPKNRSFFLRKVHSLIKYQNNAKSRWFNFKGNSKSLFLDRIDEKLINDADATISTWWSLVEPISKLSSAKGIKINLIQGYEDWEGNVTELHNSYKIKNVKHIVVSPFLRDKVSLFNNEVIYIPNSIYDNEYYSYISFDQRNDLSFCMCYSPVPLKGFEIGLVAILNLKVKYPKLELTVFGTSTRPKILPDWVIYHRNPPNLKSIYNGSKYFLSCSLNEGWGLPIHEAMACGCIIICSKIDGHRQFFEHFDGVFSCDLNVEGSIETQLSTIINSSEETKIMLSKCNESIRIKYSWKEAVNSIEQLILKNNLLKKKDF